MISKEFSCDLTEQSYFLFKILKYTNLDIKKLMIKII